MKFKVTSKNKDGYREIINFKTQDGEKSFTSTHLYKTATCIVKAKSKADLLKDIEKFKYKSKINPKTNCIDLRTLDCLGLENNMANPYGVEYSNYNNVESDQEAQQLADSGELFEEVFWEIDLPVKIEELKK